MKNLAHIKLDRPLGEQSLELTVNRRKNRPYRHALSRNCVRCQKNKKGEVMLGPKLCAVPKLYEFLKKDSVNTLAAKTQSPEFTPMQYNDVSRLNRMMKEVALADGDPRAMSSETHGPRRGYACDLALAGASLSKILENGDWRSESFRAYLESIRDQSHNRGLKGILGVHSEGEGYDL